MATVVTDPGVKTPDPCLSVESSPAGASAVQSFDTEAKPSDEETPTPGQHAFKSPSKRSQRSPRLLSGGGHYPSGVNQTFGHIPNVVRRAVPLEDLREHPSFYELPHPSEVRIQCFQHLSLYRKDSWQYTNLIKGRLNCNQLAAILGFYENKYSAMLKIPSARIGHKHAVDIWEALKEKPISDFQQPWTYIFSDLIFKLQRIAKNGRQRYKRQTTKWKHTTKSIFMFDYEPHKFAAFKQYRDLTSGRMHNADQPGIQWQRAHDPVGLLAAVNMFGKLGAKIKEVGMLPLDAVGIPATFHVQQHRLSMPLMSASPHAIIEWYNGTIEVLTVVSKCPFQRAQPKPNETRLEYRVVSRDPEASIPPWMYPQIQFQIFCAGIKTTSAIVIVATPTGGMNIFRVPKIQQYVDHMLTFVHMFHEQFIVTNPTQPPPENFFSGIHNYETFLTWTADLAAKIPMLTHIPSEMVQCNNTNHPSNNWWFLENVPNPFLTGQGPPETGGRRGQYNRRGEGRDGRDGGDNRDRRRTERYSRNGRGQDRRRSRREDRYRRERRNSNGTSNSGSSPQPTPTASPQPVQPTIAQRPTQIEGEKGPKESSQKQAPGQQAVQEPKKDAAAGSPAAQSKGEEKVEKKTVQAVNLATTE